ncbi:MAG: hypothetical protein LBR24_01745 [Methanobrevibacter sp.]|jgi:hypothetical protein|nr:hypothetical protein [Methanobrevibacter sp.]
MKEKDIEIGFDDINYAVYKIGNWAKEYRVNLIGKANEIPVTQVTVDHVSMSMEEIRKSVFEVGGEELNGILALSLQLDPALTNIPLTDLIAIEEEEYKDIVKELKNLVLEDEKKTVPLENDDYLIYKLEKDHHVTIAKPANSFTEKHHQEEIEKLKEKQLQE